MSERGPRSRRATYQDVLDAPAPDVAQVVDGELYLTPRRGGPYEAVRTSIGFELGTWFHHGTSGAGGWILLDQPELHFGEDVLVPDLAAWRRDRMPSMPDTPYFTLAPDWVCEVAWQAENHLDPTRKLAVYGREGVQRVWLVNPPERSLEVLHLQAGTWQSSGVHSGSAVVHLEPFEMFSLDLSRLWFGIRRGASQADVSLPDPDKS
jgi:Uma2 family endonuclease